MGRGRGNEQDWQQVRRRRDALGVTQRELANEVDMSESGLRAIETGLRKVPYRLKEILAVLDRMETEREREKADYVAHGGPEPDLERKGRTFTRQGGSDSSSSQPA